MILLAGIICLHAIYKQRRFPYWMLTAGVIVLVWLLIASLTFGTPIPNSVSARLTAIRVPFPLGAALFWMAFGNEVIFIHLSLYFCLLGVVALIRSRDRNRGYWLLLLWSGLYFIVASFLAGSYPWYYAPLIPAFAIMVSYGINLVSTIPLNTKRDNQDKPDPDKTSAPLFFGILATLAIIQAAFWLNNWKTYSGKQFDHRYLPYQQAAEWLNDHAKEEQSLATAEIGYLGYSTNMRIIDLYGLVTSGLNPFIEIGLEETLKQALIIYAPDYVLIKTDEEQIQIMESDHRYQFVQEFTPSYLLYEITH